MSTVQMPEPPHRALVGLFDSADDVIPLVFERDDTHDTDVRCDHWYGVADETPYRWQDVLALAAAKGWQVVRLFRADDPAITVNEVLAG
ncbi:MULTISPECIES: hypothetical protein [unclassified Micromonospora]|uniref:hypothetical protein n=1 Tax=unclassified Micromonospora TaxID=2617518 RepID=UPI00331DB3F0